MFASSSLSLVDSAIVDEASDEVLGGTSSSSRFAVSSMVVRKRALLSTVHMSPLKKGAKCDVLLNKKTKR